MAPDSSTIIPEQGAGTPSVPHTAAAPGNPARRYLAGLAGGMFGMFGLLGVSFVLLAKYQFLPAPAIANSGCLDEKLSYLRDHLPVSPNLLVMGSSVAWRHFDSSVVARNGTRPFNGGFCGLSMNQSHAAADWLLKHMPSIQRGVLIVSPQDFERCAGVPIAFDTKDADAYVFDHEWEGSFYLRYFDPVSLARNIWHEGQERAHLVPLDPRDVNQYGDGPLDTDASRELTYGALNSFDGACFSELHGLALDFQRAGRPLGIVLTPLHPDWKQSFDPDRALLTAFNTKMAQAIEGTGAQYFDADSGTHFAKSAFTDAIHLRWSAAHELTEAIAQALDL